MLIGYAYTRTGDSDLHHQRRALTAAGCTRIFEDRATSGDPRPARQEAFDQLCEGDTLVVTKLDRLTHPCGRFELRQFADLLRARKTEVRSLSERWINVSSLVPSCLHYDDYKKDPLALRPVYEAFVQMVLEKDNNFKVEYPYELTLGYETDVGIENWATCISRLLEMFLYTQTADDFNYEKSHEFCEKLRRMGRWHEISFQLDDWFHRIFDGMLVQPNKVRYFLPPYKVNDDVDIHSINPALFEFSCYIAIGHLKYGPSYASLRADEIFEVVSALGSNIPSQLKKFGSGELPSHITKYRDDEVTFKANDAFGKIRIAIKSENEDNYRKVLEHLVALLKAEFPPSYAIEFQSPTKVYLPIKGLPKKGVNQLFTNATTYPVLWPLIEEYARLAMREFEYYSNMPEENVLMPGTFAVFALTLVDDNYIELCLDYLRLCDGEHQSAHAHMIHAYIAKYGFTSNAIQLLVAVTKNIQFLSSQKVYPSLIANRASMELLAEARKVHESEALTDQSDDNTLWAGYPGRAWQNLLIAIWGDIAIRDPERIVKSAPEDLKRFYRAVLRQSDIGRLWENS